MNRWMNRAAKVTGILLIPLLMGGCGNNSGSALPAPPPQVANPGVALGSCGAVGGVPLFPDQQPVQARLMGGDNLADTLTLSLFSNTSVNLDYSTQTITGSAQMNFPTLQTIWSAVTGNPTQLPMTSFCVSSINPNGGAPTPGTLSLGQFNPMVPTPCGPSSTQNISLTLQGLVQLTSPYNGFTPGGTPGFIQDLVTVSIGPSGQYPAVLCQRRLYGFATVKVSVDVPRVYQLQ